MSLFTSWGFMWKYFENHKTLGTWAQEIEKLSTFIPLWNNPLNTVLGKSTTVKTQRKLTSH
jgi:hypothetical protein